MPFSVTPKGVFSLKWLARLSLTALFLLPCLYWSLDLLLHLLEEPWYLLANFVLPVAISLVAYACCVCWGRRLGWGYVLGLSFGTWLGIWLLGPWYLLVGSHLVWEPVSGPGLSAHDAPSMMLSFPFLSTVDVSTYDGSLPAPFFTAIGVVGAGWIYQRLRKSGHAGTYRGTGVRGVRGFSTSPDIEP